MQSSSSTSAFLTAPGSGRAAAIATLLLLGAAAGALTTLVLQKAGRVKRHVGQLQSLLHPDLPPSTLDVASLSRLELGSDSVRALFFLAFRSATLPIGGTFANHGSYGAVPRPVMRYFQDMLQRVEANPDLWFRMHSWIMTRKAILPFVSLQRAHTPSVQSVPSLSILHVLTVLLCVCSSLFSLRLG